MCRSSACFGFTFLRVFLLRSLDIWKRQITQDPSVALKTKVPEPSAIGRIKLDNKNRLSAGSTAEN